MGWHEDFEDEPTVEERMPFGLPPVEIQALHAEASVDRCESCGESFPCDYFEPIGYIEYCTMDLDCDTRICSDCLEERRASYIPDDPELFDCLTPVHI